MAGRHGASTSTLLHACAAASALNMDVLWTPCSKLGSKLDFMTGRKMMQLREKHTKKD